MSSVPRRTAEVQVILDDLRRIVRALREWSQAAVESVGLTGAQLFVLDAIADAPAISLNQLAARTRTHQSTVSEVVSRLVERGLVRRVTSAKDARKIELALTRTGRTRLDRAPTAPQTRLIAALERLSPRDRARLSESLSHLVATMNLADESPQMFFEEPAARRAARVR